MAKKRMIMLGPPGAGKGTQAELLSRYLGVPQISTGDMLRRVCASGSALGQEISSCLREGLLVPDHLINAMVTERLREEDCRQGFLLDGYPRTVEQSKALMQSEDMIIDWVIEFVIPDDDIIQRMNGRRVHLPSGRTYHIEHKPPRVDGKDDITGEALVQREDDKPETVRRRLEVYREQTQPVVDYFHRRLEKGKTSPRLVTISGVGPIRSVFTDLKKAINLDE